MTAAETAAETRELTIKRRIDTDRERHEQMGFHEGWGKCGDQLAIVAQSL